MRKILLLIFGIFLISMVGAFSVEEKLGITYDATSSSSTKWAGEYINVTRLSGIEIVSFNISKLSTANKCYVLDTSNGSLYSGTITNNNCTLATHPRLEYGTSAVIFVNKTADWDRRQKTPVVYPISNSYFYFIQGVFGASNYTNYAFEIDAIVINIPSLIENNVSIISQTYNSSSVETKLETFFLNITANGTGSVTARLIYNGTDYGLGTSSGTNSNLQFMKTINIPDITSQNKSQTFFWNITWNSITDTLQYNTQFVNKFLFSLCNISVDKKFMNLTFKDETTNTFINASLPSATFTYWLNNQTLNKSYTLINNTNNYEYDFCLISNDAITSKTNLQYQGTDYPQRLYTDTLSLSNVTLNKTLYLLGSTDGIYVTFQVQNANTEQTISGVSVVGTREIDGSDVIVALGTTDSAGSVTFWLNPDFSHTLNFTKSGYDNFETTIFPTQTSYTISMTTGTGSTTSTDYTKGVSYLISPSGGDKVASLSRNTLYNFTYVLSSSYWDISSFGFNLFYGNGSLIGTMSSISNGGALGMNANTLNESYMKMNFFYVVNSTYYNGTRTWYVESASTDFSILHFFEDLTLYITAEMFGIDDFGRIILSFFIIVMVIGGMAMRYGIQNEAMIMGMLFGLVYLLDIGIELIPQISFAGTSIPHFVTILTGLLLLGFLIKEESR